MPQSCSWKRRQEFGEIEEVLSLLAERKKQKRQRIAAFVWSVVLSELRFEINDLKFRLRARSSVG